MLEISVYDIDVSGAFLNPALDPTRKIRSIRKDYMGYVRRWCLLKQSSAHGEI